MLCEVLKAQGLGVGGVVLPDTVPHLGVGTLPHEDTLLLVVIVISPSFPELPRPCPDHLCVQVSVS